MSRLLIAELRARAAQLALAATRTGEYAYALQGASSRARINRKQSRDASLAAEYGGLADRLEKDET